MSCGGCAERRAWIGAKVGEGVTLLQRWLAGERGQTPEETAKILEEIESQKQEQT